jgi:hypothetical protein
MPIENRGLFEKKALLPNKLQTAVSKGNFSRTFWATAHGRYLLKPQHIVLFD